MSDNKFGVITEQGYPIGQFGFNAINEEERKNIEESEKNKKTNKNEGKE